MEYKRPAPEAHEAKFKPRLIIHGGAGNIPSRDKMPPETYAAYRKSLLTIISKTDTFMRTPLSPYSSKQEQQPKYPSALAITTYAVTLLEDDALFNAGHGAVFTRDGINELEASVMVSRPSSHAHKRGVGVTGLRRVRNPIQLARAVLEHGDADLSPTATAAGADDAHTDRRGETAATEGLDVPSAQGHTLIHGATAEALAQQYGLALVPSSYFYTQKRWDEHVRGLERARRLRGGGGAAPIAATWSPDEYLPQGTCGAVALDADGVLCAATSTGGLTNKLTGRIGDTPVVGAGFWAEEWQDDEDGEGKENYRQEGWRSYLSNGGPAIELSSALRGFLADCLPSPFLYTPLTAAAAVQQQQQQRKKKAGDDRIVTTRATAISGTGNGDSFLRTAAARSVAAMARWGVVPVAEALFRIAGPGGELQRSASDRWGRTGEGEGGMIGIETVVRRDAATGRVVSGGGVSAAVVMHDHNSPGMYRAWIDDAGTARFKIWRDYEDEDFSA
ncbi:hypothetical protein SLS62_002347 [Diatrype stigma]|uniref:L-asparaginase n=1 Tax=Diatrype stigma TaxID=117547 RepID=A0AAN9YVC5_9PEZI